MANNHIRGRRETQIRAFDVLLLLLLWGSSPVVDLRASSFTRTSDRVNGGSGGGEPI
jgi:hypothetical protein